MEWRGLYLIAFISCDVIRSVMEDGLFRQGALNSECMSDMTPSMSLLVGGSLGSGPVH